MPYNFMAVEKAKTVFIVEGEKDVNTLTRLGLVGSCNSGGAGNWPDEITKYFKGKKIVLVPDNDKPGLAHADSVGRKLHSIAKAIKIISLPDLAEKGDVTDWVKAGGTKERLLELVKQGKVWTPGPVGQKSADDWGEPYALPGKILKAPALPIDSLPTAVANFIKDNVRRIKCHPDLIAIPLIISLAGLIGRKVQIWPKRADNWTERLCLWGINICDKGQMKSPALKIAVAKMRKIQKGFNEEFKGEYAAWKKVEEVRKERQKTYKKLCEAAMKKGGDGAELPEKSQKLKDLELVEKPVKRRMIVKDVTIEKLADLMEVSPGLTLVRDELAGFLLNMSRYNTGSDRQFFLECYSGGEHNVDRINRGEQEVEDMYLNIVGGIQPPVAKELFDSE
ncbi:MAG: DUF3987 domain-containing protein, partial [Lentisphaerae bacterium]|nr:DUF3987 domain-containing protein [Lentisphaerota bacterium]